MEINLDRTLQVDEAYFKARRVFNNESLTRILEAVSKTYIHGAEIEEILKAIENVQEEDKYNWYRGSKI